MERKRAKSLGWKVALVLREGETTNVRAAKPWTQQNSRDRDAFAVGINCQNTASFVQFCGKRLFHKKTPTIMLPPTLNTRSVTDKKALVFVNELVQRLKTLPEPEYAI